MRTLARLLASLVVLAAAASAHAATIVPGGTISTNQTWTAAGSPYLIEGDLTFAGNTTWVIGANTVILAMDDQDTQGSGETPTKVNIMVLGTLQVGANVTFGSVSGVGPNRWGGLRVDGPATFGPGLTVRNGVRGLTSYSPNLQIDGATFEDIVVCGLEINGGGNHVATDIVVRRAQTAVCFLQADGATVDGVEILQTPYGVRTIWGSGNYHFRRVNMRGGNEGVTVVQNGPATVQVEDSVIVNVQQGILFQGPTSVQATVRNVTVANNLSAPFYVSGAQVDVFNSITAWSNFSPFIVDGGALRFHRSNVFPPEKIGAIEMLDGSTTLAPGFVAVVPEAYFVPGGDYRLAPGSPLVNRGFNGFPFASTDFVDNPRPYVGGTVDMGAYELQQPAVQSITFPPLPDRLASAPPFPVAAVATQGLPVAFASLTPAVCSVFNTTVTLVGTNGTCTIQAIQNGTVDTLPAMPVSQSFNVAGALPNLSGPATVDFGTLGVGEAFPPTPATIANAGFGAGSVIDVVITGQDAAQFGVTNNCAVIAPQMNCALDFSFTPTTAIGMRNAIATVTTNDPAHPQIVIALMGNVVFAADADSDGDGIPNGVEVAEGRNPFAKDNDIFANSRLFAMQQYRDFLGREGDAPGVDLWTNQTSSGAMSRAQVVEAFFDSQEFQNGLPQVTRLYFAFFNRIADYPGLLFHTGRYRVGVPLNTIAEDFAGSQEFLLTYGSLTNGQYVDLVYQNVLGRPADPAGRANALAQLDGNVLTRGELMAAFSESQEHINLTGPKVFVTAIYVGMLRRSPDAPGLQNWVGAFAGGLPRTQMLQAFLDSQEYHNRFLP